MLAPIRKNIPEGKFRVVRIRLSDHQPHLVKDCASEDEAFELADKHNEVRTNRKDDVYYVYNDRGKYLRGNEAVTKDEGETAAA